MEIWILLPTLHLLDTDFFMNHDLKVAYFIAIADCILIDLPHHSKRQEMRVSHSPVKKKRENNYEQ